MSNENSQNGTPMNATTADAPPPPTANGSSNGAAIHAAVETPADVAATNAEQPHVESAVQAGHATAATSSKKKDKKRDRKKARDAQRAAASDTAANAVANTAPVGDTATETVVTETVVTETVVSATPAEPPKSGAESPTAAPVAPPQPASPTTSELPAAGAPPIATQEGGLRLRMKVWTDPETLKRYLMTTAFMRDMVNGRPVSDVMRAYAMSEEDTRVITLRVAEWNTLPFFYFQEDGPAPRASRRPVDRLG